MIISLHSFIYCTDICTYFLINDIMILLCFYIFFIIFIFIICSNSIHLYTFLDSLLIYEVRILIFY